MHFGYGIISSKFFIVNLHAPDSVLLNYSNVQGYFMIQNWKTAHHACIWRALDINWSFQAVYICLQIEGENNCITKILMWVIDIKCVDYNLSSKTYKGFVSAGWLLKVFLCRPFSWRTLHVMLIPVFQSMNILCHLVFLYFNPKE